MATIPTVQVWSTGQFVTSSQMNAGIGNVLSWLLSTPRAVIYNSGSAAWASSATPAAATWTTELVDTDAMWASGTPTRLKANTAGLYFIEGAWHFSIFTTGNAMMGVGLNTNGSWGTPNKLQEATSPPPSANFGPSLNTSFSYFLNVGDYLELFAAQTSGATSAVYGSYFAGHFGAKWLASS